MDQMKNKQMMVVFWIGQLQEIQGKAKKRGLSKSNFTSY